MAQTDAKAEELAAIVQEIRDRVRARHPNGGVSGGIPLPDLTPLVHARDAAEAKVASIGTVNPRAPGFANNIVQFVKRQVARGLDWHVREQVEFNRAVMSCVHSTLTALSETNRAMSELAGKVERSIEIGNDLADIRSHWQRWRDEWQQKLAANEIHFLRSISELQAAYQHRVTLMDGTHRDQIEAQHAAFSAELARANAEMQSRFWTEFAKVRSEYEALIHAELRLLRQKTSFTQQVSVARENAVAAVQSASSEVSGIDWIRFAETFRGSEEMIHARQKLYADRFRGLSGVLDIGCGRGELLQVFKDAGISARGIDLNDDSLALSRAKGLDVEKADLFTYLENLPDGSLGGLASLQVVEHLQPAQLPQLIRLARAKLRPGALLAFETPNPECLAIFATHFFIDPTHTRPIPPALMFFYLQEAGFGAIEIERLSPAIDSLPSVASLPEDFRKQFFGALDYAIFARKL